MDVASDGKSHVKGTDGKWCLSMIKLSKWFIEKTFFSEWHDQNGAERSWIWLAVETKVYVGSWGYTHLHTFHGCSNHPDSLCFQAWNYGQKKPSSICPCPVERRAQILFVDHPRWLKTRGFSWGKLIMDLDWWEHLIVLIHLDFVLKGESVLDSLSRLPSAGLHQNLRFTSCLKKCLILHHSNIVRLLHVLRQKAARSSWNHRMVIPAINWSILIHYPSPIHPESSLVRSGEIPQDAKQPDAPWRS